MFLFQNGPLSWSEQQSFQRIYQCLAEQFALPLGSGDMHQRASAPAPFFPDVNAVNQQGAQFFNNMAANPITQMGLAYGQNYLQNSKVNGERGIFADVYVRSCKAQVGSWFSVDPLKYYFNVNNSYVYNKLRIILFPWLHKVTACARVLMCSCARAIYFLCASCLLLSH